MCVSQAFGGTLQMPAAEGQISRASSQFVIASEMQVDPIPLVKFILRLLYNSSSE